MPTFRPFELEHYQSLYEHTVDYNLADSSVRCLGTREWLSDDEIAALLDTGLFYPEVNGTRALREAIAALYPGAAAEQILVTVGASQANSMVCATLLEAGDEIVTIAPGYRQVWGLAHNTGCVVHDIALDAENGWRLDMAALEQAITPRTRLVALVNPNNPTGTVFSPSEMQQIVAACARVGAWLHADEVYRGTELASDDETPSFWGMYDRVICSGSLSKAYGLAGLRIGWAVAPAMLIDALWRRHEYAVIAAAAPSMTLATIALQPAKRHMLLERQRRLSRTGRRLIMAWLEQLDGRVRIQPAAATSIAFVRFHLPITSFALAERIRHDVSVLVAPGSALGAEHHLRITVGYEPAKVQAALDRIATVIARV
ncbi:MAG TPA: aminotransferase class I/II-fold pyridoxal phosphate-dependent enzyme [Roseiflexaceae bacterium]|mgnify:FL=1|nr:aminotransferase class I/II-fold pyridoxal phosphate-dependent enzyme [Roseiflexaceae bacterium]